MGFVVVDGDVLESFRQVEGEPGEGGVSDANGLQTAEDGLIDGIEGSTEVEEENGEGAGVRGE